MKCLVLLEDEVQGELRQARRLEKEAEPCNRETRFKVEPYKISNTQPVLTLKKNHLAILYTMLW